MRRRTREERHTLLDEYARSGLTQQAFADSRGLNVDTFRSWLYAERRASAQATDTLRFVEVSIDSVPSNTPVRLSVGKHVSIDLPELPPASYLVELARLADSC